MKNDKLCRHAIVFVFVFSKTAQPTGGKNNNNSDWCKTIRGQTLAVRPVLMISTTSSSVYGKQSNQLDMFKKQVKPAALIYDRRSHRFNVASVIFHEHFT